MGLHEMEDLSRHAKKRRRKVARSCEFCRRRKLKCDQMRPQCSTCHSRGLEICKYSIENPNLLVLSKPAGVSSHSRQNGDNLAENNNNNDNNNNNFNNKSNNDDKLITQPPIERHKLATTEVIPPLTFRHKNIYKDNYYLQCSKDGSRIIYGPTSLRQLIFKRYAIFLHPEELSAGLPGDSQSGQDKKGHGFLIDPNFNMSMIINDLPTFDALLSLINRFFHVFNKGLYPIYSILDEQKVLNDFYSIFIPNNKIILNNGERPLLHILVNEDTNCANNYKIGIILLIVVITSCWEELPKSFHDFFIILTGTISMKCMFIERLQFLLLEYYTKSLHSSIENSQANDDYFAELVNISDSLITGAISMGLHYDVKKLYRGQEHVVGNLDNLDNLRLWIVLVDYEIALKVGRPLMIRNTTVLSPKEDKEIKDIIIDEDGLTTYMTNGDKQETIFFNKLKKFLRMARPVINNIHEEEEIDLRSHIESIINFITTEFGNLEYFIDIRQMRQKKTFKDYFLVSQALHLVIILLTIANEFRSKEMISQSKHEVLPQILLFALKLMKMLMHRALKLDKERFPELVEWRGNMSPYMISTLFIINNLLPSVLVVFHIYIYGKVSKVNTNDETGDGDSSKEYDFIVFTDLYDILGIHCDPLDTTMLKFLESYKQIIDEWWGLVNGSLRAYLIRNHVFTNLMTLEHKFRSVVEPLVEITTSFHGTIDHSNKVHFMEKNRLNTTRNADYHERTSKPLGSGPTKFNKKAYSRPMKPAKTVKTGLKMYNSFSIGRPVDSVRHGSNHSMFQEFQVTQVGVHSAPSNKYPSNNTQDNAKSQHTSNDFCNSNDSNRPISQLTCDPSTNEPDFDNFKDPKVNKDIDYNSINPYWNSN